MVSDEVYLLLHRHEPAKAVNKILLAFMMPSLLWRYDTGFTYLLITEQILLDNSNAGEDSCMLLSPVLLKVVEAQAWLAIYKKRQSHSFLRHD